jgi:hypothetical protein
MAYQFPHSVLLIFCKAPIAGQVKTRLQPALTAEAALASHCELARMTLERAFEQALCPVELWCAPDSGHAFFQQCAADYPLSLNQQQGKDLGERMNHALTAALSRYESAILIGCDCPSLKPEHLSQALQTLNDGSDAVIAPAEDGGYVLVGLNTPQPSLFQAINWSTPSVMTETRQRAVIHSLKLHELAMQWDVDTIEDWLRYLDDANSGW